MLIKIRLLKYLGSEMMFCDSFIQRAIFKILLIHLRTHTSFGHSHTLSSHFKRKTGRV